MAGKAQYFVDHPVALTSYRMGWFTCSWTPLRDEAGAVKGFYCTATETTGQFLAQRALRENEERLRFSLRGAGAAAWQWDFETQEQVWSPESFELHGRDPRLREPSYDDWLHCLHPDDRSKIERVFQETVEKKLPEYRTEYRVVLPSGEVRWLNSLAKVDYAEDGKPSRMSGINLDITKRKQAEEALRESEGWLRLALKGSGAAAWQWDIVTNEQVWSPESYELHERDPKLGPPNYEDWLHCLHPDDRTRVDRAVFDAVERRSPEYRAEYRVVLPSGDVRWVDGVGKVDYGADGRPLRMSGINLDITERKRAEEALRKAEEHQRQKREELETILAVIPAAVIIATDHDCGEMTGNRAAYELLRLPPDAILSKSAPPDLAPKNYEVFSKGRRLSADEMPIQRAAATQRAIVAEELEVRFVEGDSKVLLSNARPLFDDAGKVRGAVGAFIDITALKRTEAALRESEERLRFSLKGARAAAWQWDILKDEQVWSPESYELHELDPELGPPNYKGWLHCLHPDDRVRVEQAVFDAVERRSPEYRTEYRVVRPSGGVRWVDALGRVDYGADGRPLRMSGINLDITEHKRAEEALRESEERLRFALKGSRAAVWETNISTRQIIWSEDCCELHGRDPKLGSPRYDEWLACLHPDDVAKVEQSNLDALIGRVVEFKSEYRVLLPTGDIRWINAAGKVDYDAKGAPLRVLGIVLDATASKEAELALEKAEHLERQRRQELETILAAIPAAVLIAKDASCNELTGNPAIYDLLGLPPGTNLSKSAPGGAPRNFEIYQNGLPVPLAGLPIRKAVAAKCAVSAQELEFRFVEGRSTYVLGNALPLLDAAGEVCGAVAAYADITALKCTEAALRESEARLQFALHAAAAGSWEVSLATGEMTASDQAIAFLGLPPGARATHETALARVHPDDRAGLEAALSRTFETGKALRLVYRVPLADGSMRWLESRAERRSVSGNMVVAGLVLDVTDRKRSEIALQESEQRLKFALEAGNAGTWEYVPETGEFTASDRALAMHGAPPGTPMSFEKAMATVHPEDRDSTVEANLQAVRNGKPFRVELRMPLPDGSIRWVESCGEPRFVAGRQVISGLLQDITDRKRAEIAMRESEERLQFALQAAKAGTVEILLETGEVFVSDRARELLGLPSEMPLSPEAALACLSAEDRVRIVEGLGRTLATGQPYRVETQVPLPDGSVRWLESHGELRSVAGKRMISGLIQDITERKQAELALRESEELLRSIVEHAPIPILLSREDRKNPPHQSYADSAYWVHALRHSHEGRVGGFRLS